MALRAVFFDDGTFGAALQEESLRLFPGARIVAAGEVEQLLERYLPAERFPVLRGRRQVYPNLRKLTDVHCGADGWRLVLDSDMLFFRRPDRLLDWLQAPRASLHMTDVHDSYGYSRALMESLAGAPVPERLNVGICGLRSDALDWERIEFWARRLQETEGTSYYQEQALIAMWLAGRETIVLPEGDYRLMPDDAECRDPSAVMHHYVDLSKCGYFRYAWRALLSQQGVNADRDVHAAVSVERRHDADAS